jgi:hypothetical protein
MMNDQAGNRLIQHLCKPDDGPNKRKSQILACPNVLFEAGVAMGRHPEKLVVVQVGKLRAVSVVGGGTGEEREVRANGARRG